MQCLWHWKIRYLGTYKKGRGLIWNSRGEFSITPWILARYTSLLFWQSYDRKFGDGANKNSHPISGWLLFADVTAKCRGDLKSRPGNKPYQTDRIQRIQICIKTVNKLAIRPRMGSNHIGLDFFYKYAMPLASKNPVSGNLQERAWLDLEFTGRIFSHPVNSERILRYCFGKVMIESPGYVQTETATQYKDGCFCCKAKVSGRLFRSPRHFYFIYSTFTA